MDMFARMEQDHGAAVSSDEIETCIARSSTRPQRLRFLYQQACHLLGRTHDVTARQHDDVDAQGGSGQQGSQPLGCLLLGLNF